MQHLKVECGWKPQGLKARAHAIWNTAAVLSTLTLCNVASFTSASEPPASRMSHGERLAREICSACHVVASDQEFPPLLREPAPSFAEIANRQGIDEQSLRRFITTTHWDQNTLPMSMPSMQLNADQVRAVSRYILTFKTR